MTAIDPPTVSTMENVTPPNLEAVPAAALGIASVTVPGGYQAAESPDDSVPSDSGQPPSPQGDSTDPPVDSDDDCPDVSSSIDWKERKNFIPEVNFFRAIIEEPYVPEPKVKGKTRRRNNGSINLKKTVGMKDSTDKMVYYPKLTDLANHYIDHWGVLKWDRMDSNATRMRKNLVNIMLEMRNKVLFSDLRLGEEFKELLPDGVLSCFYLTQDKFMEKCWDLYGLSEKKFAFTSGDRVRLVYILTHPDNRDDIEILFGIICKDASQLDSVDMSKPAIWARLAMIFNSTETVVMLSVTAKTLCDEHGIFPNDKKRRAIPLCVKYLQKCHENGIPHYKEAFRKWTMETGNGPSDVELFAGGYTDARADGDFLKYDKTRRAWLAVYYIFDKANGFPLLQRQADVPD